MYKPQVLTDRKTGKKNVVDIVALELVWLERVPIEEQNDQSGLLNEDEQE